LTKLPSMPQSHIARGAVFHFKGNFAAAAGEFERALKLAPDSIEAMKGLASAKISAGKADEARAAVEARLAKTPKDPALLLLAAKTLVATHDDARAEATLRQAL